MVARLRVNVTVSRRLYFESVRSSTFLPLPRLAPPGHYLNSVPPRPDSTPCAVPLQFPLPFLPAFPSVRDCALAGRFYLPNYLSKTSPETPLFSGCKIDCHCKIGHANLSVPFVFESSKSQLHNPSSKTPSYTLPGPPQPVSIVRLIFKASS